MDNETKTAESEAEISVQEHIPRESEQKLYEACYLLKPGLEESRVLGTIEAIRSTIAAVKGMVLLEDSPKAKRLAYKIAKCESADYGWMRFTAKPEMAEALAGKIGRLENVLRSRIVKVKTEKITERKPLVQRPPVTREESASTEEIDKRLEEILG